MKVLAVDDEAIMLERLRECICEVLPQVEVYDFRRPSAALAFAADNPVELAFLDIEMRGMDGITLGKKLSALLPQLNIIYTTAYADYAFDAYQLNASGYLLIYGRRIRFQKRDHGRLIRWISARRTDRIPPTDGRRPPRRRPLPRRAH